MRVGSAAKIGAGGAVGDDKVASSRGRDQRLAFERLLTLVQHHLAERLQAGKRAGTIIIVAHVRGVGEQDLHRSLVRFVR